MDREEFTQCIRQLASLSRVYSSDDQWTVKKEPSTSDCYAELNSFAPDMMNRHTVKRVCSLCYNEAYRVPVLWFNFYSLDGSLLLMGSACSWLRPDSVNGTLLMQGVSQNEHPVHGISFYNFHPCRTAEILEEMGRSANRVISLLSIIGVVAGYEMPLVMLEDGTKNDPTVPSPAMAPPSQPSPDTVNLPSDALKAILSFMCREKLLELADVNRQFHAISAPFNRRPLLRLILFSRLSEMSCRGIRCNKKGELEFFPVCRGSLGELERILERKWLRIDVFYLELPRVQEEARPWLELLAKHSHCLDVESELRVFLRKGGEVSSEIVALMEQFKPLVKRVATNRWH